MDKINFTGFKNTGALQFARYEDGKYPVLQTNLLAQLTDDYMGKDIMEFESALKKCKSVISVPKFYDEDRFVYITSSVSANPKELPKISINGVNIPSVNETMALYTYIAKLTRKIIDLPTSDKIVVNKDFLNSEDAINYVNPFGLIRKQFTQEDLNEIYSTENAKEAAKTINETLSVRMNDYLA